MEQGISIQNLSQFGTTPSDLRKLEITVLYCNIPIDTVGRVAFAISFPGLKPRKSCPRIYPNSEQQILLTKTFGCVRLVYNYFLDRKIKQYQLDQSTLTYTQT